MRVCRGFDHDEQRRGKKMQEKKKGKRNRKIIEFTSTSDLCRKLVPPRRRRGRKKEVRRETDANPSTRSTLRFADNGDCRRGGKKKKEGEKKVVTISLDPVTDSYFFPMSAQGKKREKEEGRG